MMYNDFIPILEKPKDPIIQSAKTVADVERSLGIPVSSFEIAHWSFISKHVDLSESFIIQHQAKINFGTISKFQKLSQKFMDTYAYKLNWDALTKHQLMSESFLIKHQDKIDWQFVLKNRKLSHKTLVLLIGKQFNQTTKFYFLQQLKGKYDHLTNYMMTRTEHGQLQT